MRNQEELDRGDGCHAAAHQSSWGSLIPWVDASPFFYRKLKHSDGKVEELLLGRSFAGFLKWLVFAILALLLALGKENPA